MRGTIPPLRQYSFYGVMLSLKKHRDNFTFTFYVSPDIIREIELRWYEWVM
jgi:hypothetical protein